MGGWSGRAVAQQRPRISKLGLKGASDYYSNEIALEAARREARGLNKRATLTKYLLKKNELDNRSKPNWIKDERQPTRENTTSKKELLTLYLGMLQKGVDEVSENEWKWWWVRTNRANHKSMWQHFGVLRVKCQKVSLKRQPSAYTFRGGSVLTQHQSSDTKQMVNATLTIGH